ncbi:hypothetical protein V2W45_1217461, partial [Cenococcum geophilum]
KKCNVYIKKVIIKDIKAKAQEEEHFPLINIFVVIGYNYKRIILYKVLGNLVGKMT